MSTITTFTGNLTDDPSLRFTPGGHAVTELRVAVNRRIKTSTGWEDAEPTFHNVKVWGTRAENVAESLTRGDAVNVHGHVETEAWISNGEKRTKDVTVVSDRYGFIGADLTRVTARLTKVTRNTTQNQNHSRDRGDQDQSDPWAVPDAATT